jgi:hypothetical protein
MGWINAIKRDAAMNKKTISVNDLELDREKVKKILIILKKSIKEKIKIDEKELNKINKASKIEDL